MYTSGAALRPVYFEVSKDIKWEKRRPYNKTHAQVCEKKSSSIEVSRGSESASKNHRHLSQEGA